MKKLLCVVLMVVLLCGCSPIQDFDTSTKNTKYIIGVWISFTELDKMLGSDFKAEFDTAVKNCKLRNITDVFVHIRPYCDAVYRSKLFPIRESAQNKDFDALKYMTDTCHKNGIRLHAWINPYRVRTADSDIDKLSADSPAKKWLSDEDPTNDINVCVENGIYLNPASSDVRQLIVDGIREVINNYDVDGIHFDDYFYPTTEPSFDSSSYAAYCSAAEKPITLDEWRRANVNTLIGSAYTAIKFKNKNIMFSISPSASINQNYNKHYADVTAWADSGCVDYIIPQLYFGFDYPDASFKFEKLLSDWQNAIKDTDTKLLIGLASYKINTDSEPDKTEWAKGVEVINKQVSACKQSKAVAGHIFFSYSSMVENL